MRLSSSFLEVKWPQERIDAFIEEKNLYDDLAEMKERWQDRGIDPKLYSYYTVAQFIRNQFFSTYPGLMKRMKRNEKLVKEQGYLRSFHGGIRRLPLMALAFDDAGKVRKHENKKELANWTNISANTTIQTDEAVVVHGSIASWDDDSLLGMGAVHDSFDSILEREGAKTVLEALIKHFERKNPQWQGDFSFPVDVSIVDFTKEDQYYKNGIDFEDWAKEN